jgi:predicted nucleic acid-binding protein
MRMPRSWNGILEVLGDAVRRGLVDEEDPQVIDEIVFVGHTAYKRRRVTLIHVCV